MCHCNSIHPQGDCGGCRDSCLQSEKRTKSNSSTFKTEPKPPWNEIKREVCVLPLYEVLVSDNVKKPKSSPLPVKTASLRFWPAVCGATATSRLSSAAAAAFQQSDTRATWGSLQNETAGTESSALVITCKAKQNRSQDTSLHCQSNHRNQPITESWGDWCRSMFKKQKSPIQQPAGK